MEPPVSGRLASKAELKAHLQEVEAAHQHDSRYTAKVGTSTPLSRSLPIIYVSNTSSCRSGSCQLVSPSLIQWRGQACRASAPQKLCCKLEKTGRVYGCASDCSAVPLQLWHNDPATKLAGYTKSMRNMIGDDRRAHYGVPQSRRAQS